MRNRNCKGGSTWRRTVLKEAKTAEKEWMEVMALAANRIRWRQLIYALYASFLWSKDDDDYES